MRQNVIHANKKQITVFPQWITKIHPTKKNEHYQKHHVDNSWAKWTEFNSKILNLMCTLDDSYRLWLNFVSSDSSGNLEMIVNSRFFQSINIRFFHSSVSDFLVSEIFIQSQLQKLSRNFNNWFSSWFHRFNYSY